MSKTAEATNKLLGNIYAPRIPKRFIRRSFWSYLLISLSLLLFVLQSESELLQCRAIQGVLGALELDDLVEDGPQLVQKRLDGTYGKRVQGSVCRNLTFPRRLSLCVCVCVTLLLLSSRHREMMVSRKTSCAAMMWSRSWACCTLFHSSSQEHSSTCAHTQNADAHFSKALWELHCPFMKNQIVTAAHVR